MASYVILSHEGISFSDLKGKIVHFIAYLCQFTPKTPFLSYYSNCHSKIHMLSSYFSFSTKISQVIQKKTVFDIFRDFQKRPLLNEHVPMPDMGRG